jgi:hypothetical protein
MILVNASPAFASFFDRPDYFENKKIYDEVSDIIDVIYDTDITEQERELRLRFRDQKLVPTFKALKVENETRFVQTLRVDGKLLNQEIDDLMKDRAVIDAFKITMENDFLAGTDTYYTNGLRFEIGFNNPEFEKFFKKLGFDHSDFFFLCGQEIYNTGNNDDGSLRPEQPPNAGVLYCGGAVNGYKMDKDKTSLRSLTRLEAQLGTIGQNSYAEQVQNGFHRLIGDKRVNWEYQLADRAYVNIDFQKFVKVGEGDLYGNSQPEYNVIVNAGGNAGSFTNFVNAGFMVNYRLLGTLIDMYLGNKITPTLAEELSMLSPEARLKRLICGASPWSLNFYFGGEGRYVFSNYRLAGNDVYHTEAEPLVIDLKAGLVLRYRKVFFEIGLVRRSSEWNNTNGNRDAPPHTFGIISFTVRYDNFKDLGQTITNPIRWMADPAYRKKIMDENRIRKLVEKEGVKIIYDDADPKNPAKTFNLQCSAH